jgi:hypothetical protein
VLAIFFVFCRGTHIFKTIGSPMGVLLKALRAGSPTFIPPPPPQEDSWYSFLLEAESIPGP